LTIIGFEGAFGSKLVHKKASALRRIPSLDAVRCVETAGLEGFVCLFELADEAAPIVLESETGRGMALVPGDFFLGTPGYRESTRWVVGCVPSGGLRPGGSYWVLAESGVVGDLLGDSPLEKVHLAQVTYRGAVLSDDGQVLDLRRFAMDGNGEADHGAPIFLIVGTSAEVGKTTAGIAVLRALRRKGHTAVVALKATGTSSLSEILRYRDFGAVQAFDCVDFGLPTTYPSGRNGIDAIFNRALDVTLSNASDAVLIECGGDILGGNVPIFLECLKGKRAEVKIILAAADALGALGAKQLLGEMGLSISMITGPCTDTPTLRERTQSLCGIAALNMSKGIAPI
jgi:hypothetical protein